MSRTTPSRVAAAMTWMLTAAVLAAACSSDEAESSGVSADAFVESLDGTCRTASNLIRKLDPTDSSAVSDLADYLSSALDSIGNIEPPAADRADLETFTAQIEEQITELGRIERAMRTDDDTERQDAVVQVNELRDAADTAAIKLGAAKCVGLTPADGLAPPPAPATTTSQPATTAPETTAAPTTAAATTSSEPATTVDVTTTAAAPVTTVTPATTVPATTAPPTTQPQPIGPPTVVAVEATVVRPDSTDSCGNPTSYPAINVVDGRRDSAWMGAGDATGASLVFHLAGPSTITRVGLVPGYDKFDPCTDSDRFYELRRISAVRWEFDDGTVLEQKVNPDSPSMQYIQVPRSVTTQDITMTIVSTTESGGIDHTPISEVSIL